MSQVAPVISNITYTTASGFLLQNNYVRIDVSGQYMLHTGASVLLPNGTELWLREESGTTTNQQLKFIPTLPGDYTIYVSAWNTDVITPPQTGSTLYGPNIITVSKLNDLITEAGLSNVIEVLYDAFNRPCVWYNHQLKFIGSKSAINGFDIGDRGEFRYSFDLDLNAGEAYLRKLIEEENLKEGIEAAIDSNSDGTTATVTITSAVGKRSKQYILGQGSIRKVNDRLVINQTNFQNDLTNYFYKSWTGGLQIPTTPTINGTGNLDLIVTGMVTKINNSYVPSAAVNYYKAALKQDCLPEKYNVGDYSLSITLIKNDLTWNQNKIIRLWEECAEMSTQHGTTIDPRLLLAVIMVEGTASFDTNFSLSSPIDSSGYIQPDFEKDLSNAFNNHILGKIWAYSHFATKFQRAAQAGYGKEFIVNYYMDNGSIGTRTITYTGNGDLFDYTNNNVPRIRWNGSLYVVNYGVYATDSNWCNNLRFYYEQLTGSGSASSYSILYE